MTDTISTTKSTAIAAIPAGGLCITDHNTPVNATHRKFFATRAGVRAFDFCPDCTRAERKDWDLEVAEGRVSKKGSTYTAPGIVVEFATHNALRAARVKADAKVTEAWKTVRYYLIADRSHSAKTEQRAIDAHDDAHEKFRYADARATLIEWT